LGLQAALTLTQEHVTAVSIHHVAQLKVDRPSTTETNLEHVSPLAVRNDRRLTTDERSTDMH
jgi:hypothetical protein